MALVDPKSEHDSTRGHNIAEGVFEDLRAQILRGQLKAGERLLGERELAAAYGTNRNTLREAVKKLEQARLVTVRHGRGVTVCDFRRTGTLELIYPYLLSGPDMHEVVRIVEDVLAPRTLLLEYATRLAVQRATEQDIALLKQLSQSLMAVFEERDAVQVAREFENWLEVLIDAGHSVAVRWIANPFLDATRRTLEQLPMLWVLEPTFPSHIRDVVHGIETRDEQLSVEATRKYYARVDAQLLSLLQLGIQPDLATPTENEFTP